MKFFSLFVAFAALAVASVIAQDLGASIQLKTEGGKSKLSSISRSALHGEKVLNIKSNKGQARVNYDDGSDKGGHAIAAVHAQDSDIDMKYHKHNHTTNGHNEVRRRGYPHGIRNLGQQGQHHANGNHHQNNQIHHYPTGLITPDKRNNNARNNAGDDETDVNLSRKGGKTELNMVD